MNVLHEVNRGRTGANKGLNVGCKFLNERIGGLRKSIYIGIGGEPKSGKTAFVDTMFVLNTFLLNPTANIHWYYYSNEITRVEKEAGVISTLIWRKYGHRLTAEYILGRSMDGDGNPILLSDEEYQMVEDVYEETVVPLFGRYDENDVLIEPGKITFYGYRENPTGVYNNIVKSLAVEGTVKYIPMGEAQVISGYTPNDASAVRVLIIDHIRGLQRESGNAEKTNIDTMSKYIVNLRNLFGLSTIIVGHLNRTNSDIQRVKVLGDYLYPDADLWKDSGNVSEDANVIINLFDPMDPKYGLEKHFGTPLSSHKGKGYSYRTVHIVRNRGGENPVHSGFKFFGDVKDFSYIPGN